MSSTITDTIDLASSTEKAAGYQVPWTMIGVLIFIIVLGLIAYYLYSYYMPKTSNPNEEYGTGEPTNHADMCLFYTTWCPHSRIALQEWEKIKEEYNGKTIKGYTINFIEYDCTDNSPQTVELMNKNGVKDYPTIILKKDGKNIEYDSNPSMDTMVIFLNTML